MGKVDLCAGTKHQGARCPGRYGRLDQVPGTEHPHRRATTPGAQGRTAPYAARVSENALGVASFTFA